MKILLIIPICLITKWGISQTIDSVENYVKEDTSLLSKIPYQNEITIKMGFRVFSPKKEEIEITDSVLQRRLLNDKIALKGYFLQLMFVFDSTGKKNVYIVGECKWLEKDINSEFLKSHWATFDDGGKCCFGVQIDLQKRKIINFTYEGGGG